MLHINRIVIFQLINTLCKQKIVHKIILFNEITTKKKNREVL